MPDSRPRILAIERDRLPGGPPGLPLDDRYDVVTARTMARALALLKKEPFDGVYVGRDQLDAVRYAGLLIQSDEILEAISDGVAVVDSDLKILWANSEFARLVPGDDNPDGQFFFRVMGSPEIIGDDQTPFSTAATTHTTVSATLRVDANRYLRIAITPVVDTAGPVTHSIVLARDTTSEVQQEQKLTAIHKAGEELADLTPEELTELDVEERTDLLKYNIARHMRDLMGLDFVEIRLLDRSTGRLVPLLAEGMTQLAASRELFARREGNGVTGFVAATGQSYLCTDTSQDPLYLEGAAGAGSSLTVPLVYHGTVIGTLNVENMQRNAFDDRDRQFIEIYARSVAAALNTLELLQAEKRSTASQSVEAISRELALPLDDILSDGTTVLDRYAGHDEEIVARLRHLLYRAREIRSLIQKVGSSLAPEPRKSADSRQKLVEARILVVDAEESVRRAAHHLLGRQGATVETARDAHEAVALARQSPYSSALVDIRLPDMDGYETFKRLREVQPGVPIILMTGFGYDPSHSIVKARKEGLQTVLYKPFRADRLMEAVEQALREQSSAPSVPSPGAASAATPTAAEPAPALDGASRPGS